MFNHEDADDLVSSVTTSEQLQQSAANPDGEVIAAAAAARHSKATFMSPSPPVPANKMKPTPGKRISTDTKNYVATLIADGGAPVRSAVEDQILEQSMAEESDRGEEVESPVPAMTNHSSGRRSRTSEKRRRDTDRSSSRSSSASSVEPSTKRLPKETSKQHHDERKQKKKKTHKRSRTKTRESPVRSISRSPSPVNSLPSVRRSITPVIQSRYSDVPGTSKKTTKDIPAKASSTSGSLVHRANTLMAVNDGLFKTLLHEKGDREQPVNDLDSVSRVSKRSVKRSPVVRKTFDLRELESYLPEELHGSVLVKKTVTIINKIYKTMKTRILTETLRNITYVSVDVPANPTNDPAAVTNRQPHIDGKNYLFYACKLDFGYDYETLVCKRDLCAPSLLNALRPKCNTSKHSLDMVFRMAMKELTEEIHGFEDEADTTLENPVFISGRYAELRLLKKMKEYYFRTMGLDIVKYLTDSCPDVNSPLKPLVGNSNCEMYIRKLHDRYELTSKWFDKTIAEFPSTPVKMRVWTDPSSQTLANVQISNFVRSVYEESSRKWDSLSDEEKVTRPKYKDFLDDYATEMKAFIKTHGRLVTEMLRASELMTYLCLGLTTNVATLGSTTMATSYCLARKDKTNPFICWNFPLGMIHRRKPVFTMDEYCAGFDELLNMDTTD